MRGDIEDGGCKRKYRVPAGTEARQRTAAARGNIRVPAGSEARQKTVAARGDQRYWQVQEVIWRMVTAGSDTGCQRGEKKRLLKPSADKRPKRISDGSGRL